MPKRDLTACKDGNQLLDFDANGAGPALLFVHAGIADRRMWRPQWDAFRGRFRLIRVDLRGYGTSPQKVSDGADHHDLIQLLDHLGVERVGVVASSFGGNVALDFALTYPDRTWALVLAGTLAGMTKPSPELHAIWAETDAALATGAIEQGLELENRAWVDGPARAPEQVDPELREFVRSMNRLIWERTAREGPPTTANTPIDRVGRLGEIAVPTLLIEGILDQPDVAESMERLAHGIPHAERVRFPNAAHLPNLEEPTAFNAATLAFLERAMLD